MKDFQDCCFICSHYSIAKHNRVGTCLKEDKPMHMVGCCEGFDVDPETLSRAETGLMVKRGENQ